MKHLNVRKLYEAVLALRIKLFCKTLISNQIRKRRVRIFKMDWYYFLLLKHFFALLQIFPKTKKPEAMGINLLWKLNLGNAQAVNLEALNAKYKKLHPTERVKQLFKDFYASGILVTSSFGTTSALLLHMLHRTRKNHPVRFINTGYLFAETLAYKNTLAKRLGLKVVELEPKAKRHAKTKAAAMWSHNPDECCKINKTEPLTAVKKGYKVWMSGLMGFQSEQRNALNIFEMKDAIIKFQPLIDILEGEAALYMKLFELPQHPLLDKGYDSVGCTHCTAKGSCRMGRWIDHDKNECGLHF